MHFQRSVTVLLSTFAVLLVGLVAGCGGGDQSGNGSQDAGSGGEETKQAGGAGGGEDTKKEISRPKIALGMVTRVDAEARRIILRPSTEKQGEKPLRFKVRPNATITLDDKEATFEDIQQGQQAQVEYVVRNDQNRARVVTLFSQGESDG